MRIVLSLLVLAATASTSAADGVYFTESVGGADVKNELAGRMESAAKIRAALGVRAGRWAVEVFFAGYLDSGVGGESRYFDPQELDVYGLDLKYASPITEHVELYLRGSMSYGQLDSYGGRGLGLGAGAQLKGKVRALGLLFWPLFFVPYGPKITAALYVDAGHDYFRLHPGGRLDAAGAIDAQLASLSLGFAFGSDF